MSINIHYISNEDINKLEFDNEEIIEAVEKSLLAQGENQATVEQRMHLIPDTGDKRYFYRHTGHFNILRGYIETLNVAGIKIVGDYVNNYKVGLPSELALINLYDPSNGVPLAIIDATKITEMRTGALTAIGAKHLARKDCKVLGHLGSRGTAWWNVVLLDALYDFEEIRVNSRRAESRNDFAQRLSEHLGKKVKAVETSEECLVGADIMVEATRLKEPAVLLKTEWIKPGMFIVPYGTISAVDMDLTKVMDKIVVDDWGQCKEGLYGSLRRHVESGLLSEENLHAEMGDIVAGNKKGRETDNETILFWHRGLSINDIALAHLILEKARESNVGKMLHYR